MGMASSSAGSGWTPSASQAREIVQLPDREKQLERRKICDERRRKKREPRSEEKDSPSEDKASGKSILDLTHDDENSSGPSEENEAGPEVEELVQGCKRSLTISQETDEPWTRSRHREWEEQAKQIPRFASWGPDSHLHTQKGQKFTRINVEGCKEIFVPENSICLYHDEKQNKDYWIKAVQKGRREPYWTDWKRWYGPDQKWNDLFRK